MFTHDGIKLFDLHLFRLSALIFRSCVIVTCTGTGYEFNFVSHDRSPLNLFTASTHIAQYLIDTQFINDAYPVGGQTQPHPTIFALHPKAVLV